jgi:nitronate monooxygenase
MKTRITELLGLKYPILCGGMMNLCKVELCAAVSNAGGLGNLTAANYPSGKDLANAIREVRKRTDQPFWVNVTLLPALQFSEENYVDFFETIAEQRVPAVEIGGTPLDRFKEGMYLRKLKEAGVKLIHKVGSVRHAVHCEHAGYDAILAAGVEEGGHPLNDNVATSVLTPRVAESVRIPVVTAGGMADGRGLAAALSLGAEGIMMATRFICTKECVVHENVQNEIIRRQEYETTLYGNSIGLQGRALLNETMRKVLEIEKRGGGLGEILPLIAGTIGPRIWQEGDTSAGSINVGQSIGLIHDVMTCKELIQNIVREAEEIIAAVKAKFEV